MMMKALGIFIPLAAALTAAAQDPPARPAFEVASVKPAEAPEGMPPMAIRMMGSGMWGMHPPGWLPLEKTRLKLERVSLEQLIATAYRVRPVQVAGPAWMADARFEIAATMPPGTTVETADEMLQTLLEERFGLRVHREDREVAGFALTVAKGGPKLTPSGGAAPEPAPPMDEAARKAQLDKLRADMMKRMEQMRQENAANGATTGGSWSTRRWPARDVTVEQIAVWLAAPLGKPVVDATGLEGKYDADIEVVQMPGDTPEYAAAQAAAKLGLKLEARKVTVAMVVVDQVERTPAEN